MENRLNPSIHRRMSYIYERSAEWFNWLHAHCPECSYCPTVQLPEPGRIQFLLRVPCSTQYPSRLEQAIMKKFLAGFQFAPRFALAGPSLLIYQIPPYPANPSTGLQNRGLLYFGEYSLISPSFPSKITLLKRHRNPPILAWSQQYFIMKKFPILEQSTKTPKIPLRKNHSSGNNLSP